MTDALPRYRFWGDRKPDAKLAELKVATAKALVVTETGRPSELELTDDQPTVAVLRIYAPIDSWGGWWGISSEDVSRALDALPSTIETIILRINCPGGEVPEAMTVLNMLRAHKARIIAVVDGWAVSAASFLAVGCDETVMSPGTQMMIHDARIFAYGDPASLRKTADRLDKDSDNIASLYVEAAGGAEPDWRALMGPETWYTAKEAVEAGLADRVDVVPDAGISSTPGTDPELDDPDVVIQVEVEESDPEDLFDLSMYRFAGRNAAPAPAAVGQPHRPPTASADGTPHTEGGTDMSFIDDVRTKLGVSQDADEATVKAALDEALQERAEPTSDQIPDGAVVVSKAEWEEMRGDAQRGAAAAKRLHEREREATLDKFRDRYLADNRKSWSDEYDRNPEATVKALSERPVIVPTDEIGTDIDDAGNPASKAEVVRTDPTYQNWEI